MLIVAQLVKKFVAYYGPEDSLPYSQERFSEPILSHLIQSSNLYC